MNPVAPHSSLSCTVIFLSHHTFHFSSFQTTFHPLFLLSLSNLLCLPVSIMIFYVKLCQMPFSDLDNCSLSTQPFLCYFYYSRLETRQISNTQCVLSNCFSVVSSLSKYSIHCILITLSHVLHTSKMLVYN